MLPLALNNLAVLRMFEGDLQAAAALVEESEAIADATGAARITFGRLILAGFRGDESAVSEQTESDTTIANARGESYPLTVGAHVSALLQNGFGRYDAARSAAETAASGTRCARRCGR